MAAGVACSGPTELDPVWIEGFLERSPILACVPVPDLSRDALVVDDLVATRSGDLLVLSGRAREVLLVDDSARVRWRLPLEPEGPGGVGSPSSAILSGDSTLLIADPGRMAIQRLSLDGQDRGRIPTPFPPLRIRRAGDVTYVVPGVVGGYPDRLLYRVEGDRLVPEQLPLRRYPGMTHGGFANRLGATVPPGGPLVLLHGFYIPEAYLWDGEASTRRPVPVPDALSPLFRNRRPVEREDDLGHLPVVGLSPFVRAETGDVTYITRSGAMLDAETWEKALIRVDPSFRYLASGRLPVDALMAGPLGRGDVLVVSNDGSWHRCEAP
jgi:hypothetical protein